MFNARTWFVLLAASALSCVGFTCPTHATTILLTDDFNDNSLDGSLWVVDTNIPQGGASAIETNQQMEFTGRAHLNTVAQFNPLTAPENGLRIRGQWTFVGSDDMLQILTRSDGTPGGGWGDTANGVQFYVGASAIGNNMTINGRGTASVTGAINSGALNAVAGETYDFNIRDDGQHLIFSMKQVGGSKYRAVMATSNSAMATNLITFHNREAGRRSNLDNVVVDSPSAFVPFSDNFNDNSLDIDKWFVVTSGIPQNPKSVNEVNQQMELEGRAHLNTVNQYDPLTAPGDGIRIRGEWTFVSSADVMQVFTRSDGTPDTGHCCGETKTGVEFSHWLGGGLGFGGRGGVSVGGAVSGATGTSAAGETWAFDIRDDGNNLFWTMRQLGGTKSMRGIAASNSVLATNLITFHNRESGRRANLDNVRIDSPQSNTVGLGGPILLEDRFNDNSLDGSKWNVVTAGIPSTPSATETNQRIQLQGRAHLNTAQEFDPAALGGLTVRGRWTFQSGDDLMQILTRSDGTPGGGYGETNAGIEFRANSTVTSDHVNIGGRGGASVGGQINANMPILAGETYDFQILDDGNELSILLKQVGGPKAAVATATSSSVMGTNLVTFHNRESGRLSHLDNVVIASGTPVADLLGGGGSFLVRDVKSTGTINNLADADALLAGTGVAGESSGLYEAINFGSGSSGLFGSDNPFPNGGGDDFAVQVTGKIGVAEAGDYVFGLNMDDGARLVVDGQTVILEDATGGARNVYGHIELSAGFHNLDLVFFERSGGEHLELFYFDGAGSRFLATAVPEPATAMLLAFGGVGVLGLTRRRRRRASGG